MHMIFISQYQKLGYSTTGEKLPLYKRLKIGLQDQLSLNAGQKYCRMLQGEHSAILPTFIRLPFVFKIFVMSIFEWPFYTGFTVYCFIPRHFEKCEVLCYTHLFKKLRSSVRPPVHASVRPSVCPSAHRFHSQLGAFFNQFCSNLL